MTALVHYTCRDAAPLIAATGILRPNASRIVLAEPLVWLTDLRPGDVPDLDLALGLRGQLVTCDRTEYRFEVLDASGVEHWPAYARRMIRAGRLSRLAREALDSTPGGFPVHWWVATAPVPVGQVSPMITDRGRVGSA